MQWLLNMLLNSQEISQYLCRMGFICQSVPDWYARMLREFINNILSVTTIFDAVIHATKYASSILHRLFIADMRTVRAKVGDTSALIIGCNLKGATRTRRVLFKDQNNL